MIMRRRRESWAEDDVFEGRRIYCWTQKPGACAWVKRNARRRERREAKAEITAQLADR
jgi:hypothetical protein